MAIQRRTPGAVPSGEAGRRPAGPSQRDAGPPPPGSPPRPPSGAPAKPGPAGAEAEAETVESLEQELAVEAPPEEGTSDIPRARDRKTPAHRQRKTTGALRAAAAPAGWSGGAAAEKGESFSRGVPLAIKYILLIASLVIVVCTLFGLVVISIFRTKLEDETSRYGRNQVLALQALGRHVYAEFKDARIGGGDTVKYQKTAQCEADRQQLLRLAAADPRIKDITIFASNHPTESPSGAVLSTQNAAGYTRPPPQEGDDEVVEWRGLYRSAEGDEQCLFFRVPIEGRGSELYATANLILSAKNTEDEIRDMRNRIVLFGLIFVGIGIGLSLFLASAVTRPIEALVRDTDVVSRGDLEHETRPRSRDEIGLLAHTFNRMTRNLLHAQEREREVGRLNSEISLAKEIHAKLLPERLPNIPGLDLFTAYTSAKEIGGDYYDFFGVNVEQGLLGIVVADVSGKGIPGSMVMGTTRNYLRMMATDNPSPADVLAKTNYYVARDIRRGMFVTMLYAILNVRTREMAVASAGHNPMVIWRSATRQHELLHPSGIALGFDRGPIFNRTIQEQRVQLKPGDRVLLYTDGVVEAMNEQRVEWGDQTLYRFVGENAELPSKDFVRLLVQALQKHQGNAEQHDDITIATFRIVS